MTALVRLFLVWLFPGGIVNQTRHTFFYSSRSFQKQNWIDWMAAVRWRMVDTCDLIDFKAHYLFLPLELKKAKIDSFSSCLPVFVC